MFYAPGYRISNTIEETSVLNYILTVFRSFKLLDFIQVNRENTAKRNRIRMMNL